MQQRHVTAFRLKNTLWVSLSDVCKACSMLVSTLCSKLSPHQNTDCSTTRANLPISILKDAYKVLSTRHCSSCCTAMMSTRLSHAWNHAAKTLQGEDGAERMLMKHDTAVHKVYNGEKAPAYRQLWQLIYLQQNVYATILHKVTACLIVRQQGLQHPRGSSQCQWQKSLHSTPQRHDYNHHPEN